MKISREKVNHISGLIVKDFKKREELDYKAPLSDVRLEIFRIFMEELAVEDNADAEVRKTLASYNNRTLREGTPEWDVLYHKHYNEYMNKHGLL